MIRLDTGSKVALGFLVAMGIGALAVPALPLPDPSAFSLENALSPPAWTLQPVLGTDAQGRDLAARILWGARISLSVGFLGSLVALLIGLPWGAVAGYRGGRADRWMMRLCDALEGVPLVVVVLFLFAILQEYRMEMASIGLGRIHLFFFAVGALFWVPTARVSRAEALRLRKAPFIEASRGIGAPTISILLRHILPHLLSTVLVMLTLTLPRVVLMEAFLSFLGLGVEAPDVSWGILAREGLEALNPLVDCWWILVLPGMTLAFTLLALQRLGDGLRDALSSPGR